MTRAPRPTPMEEQNIQHALPACSPCGQTQPWHGMAGREETDFGCGFPSTGYYLLLHTPVLPHFPNLTTPSNGDIVTFTVCNQTGQDRDRQHTLPDRQLDMPPHSTCATTTPLWTGGWPGLCAGLCPTGQIAAPMCCTGRMVPVLGLAGNLTCLTASPLAFPTPLSYTHIFTCIFNIPATMHAFLPV